MKAIPQDVLRELELAVISGDQLRLTGRMDRRLYDQVNKVIEAAGGTWNRKAGAHLFPDDAGAAIEQIILTGGVGPKQELGQFDSPPAVVARVMELAQIAAGHTVLEPSAGIGNLALEAMAAGAKVFAIEIDGRRAAQLRDLASALLATGKVVGGGFCTCQQEDFMAMSAPAWFDRAIMNPPFPRQADIDHVRHAARFVKKGGRLVAVMSAGIRFRENRKTAEFRDWLAERDAQFEDLPAGSFAASGTSVNACIVSFEQPEDPR